MNIVKQIKKIQRNKKELSKMARVPVSSIVYVGNDKYIIVKDNIELVTEKK